MRPAAPRQSLSPATHPSLRRSARPTSPAAEACAPATRDPPRDRLLPRHRAAALSTTGCTLVQPVCHNRDVKAAIEQEARASIESGCRRRASVPCPTEIFAAHARGSFRCGLFRGARQPPDLADTVDREVLGEHARDLGFKDRILPRPRRQACRIPSLRDALAVSGWGDRQDAADRLDPIGIAVIVNERDHRRNGRSSSA